MPFPILLALAAQTAPKPDPDEPMAPPVAVTAANTLYGASRSMLSFTADLLAGQPAPLTLRFECVVLSITGEAISCLRLEGTDKPATSRDSFVSRVAAQHATPPTPAERAAVLRILAMRVRTSRLAAGASPFVPMLFTQTVSASDRVAVGPSQGTLLPGTYDLEVRPDAARLNAYYPTLALRAGVEARMQATCRVLPDRSLLCHDPKPVNPPATLDTGMRANFDIATYQVLAPVRLATKAHDGTAVVGRDVVVYISFRMPKDEAPPSK